MRRLSFLCLVTLLALTGLAGGPVSAQDDDTSESWDNIVIEPLETEDAKVPLQAFLGAPSDGQEVEGGLVERLGAYGVYFQKNLAHVPEVVNPEYMIVIVQTGSFVLHVYEETFVVDPLVPREIEVLEASDSVTSAGHEIFYTSTGALLPDDTGSPCTSMCTVPQGTPVLLVEGDRIMAPAGHVCYYCLLNGDEGTLLVYPLPREAGDFSWIESRNAAVTGTPTGSSPAQPDIMERPVTSGMVAWAFFNPAPNCRSGPH